MICTDYVINLNGFTLINKIPTHCPFKGGFQYLLRLEIITDTDNKSKTTHCNGSVSQNNNHTSKII